MTEFLHALEFPFAIDRGARSAAEEGDYDDYIRQLIRQVLLTAPGERVNRPDFGAGVRRMVFAPNNPAGRLADADVRLPGADPVAVDGDRRRRGGGRPRRTNG